ncbi:hypothetical protein DVS77_02740 [Mycolicibacterium moriokaense]|nr:hypothetical protein DVS77_02740 [Mycolicibacterium moriokaense]
MDVSAIGQALAQRVHHIAAALRRLDGLEAGQGGPEASRPSPDDMRDFALRALRAVGDRCADAILGAVAEGTREEMGLVERTGISRLGLWETVGDLLQVGMLERDPVSGNVALTAAGASMLAMIDAIVTAGEIP